LTYNDPTAVAENRWLIPHAPNAGISILPKELNTSSKPRTIPIPFALCTSQLQTSGVVGQVTRVRVRGELPETSGNKPIVEGDVEIIPWGPEAQIVSSLISDCKYSEDIESFDGNLLVTQARKPNRIGDRSQLSGTLFRAGIPATRDQITFYRTERFGSQKPKGSPLATTRTNDVGEFSVAIPIGKGDRYGLVTILGIAPSRAESIGPVPGPFPEERFTLIFNWSKKRVYEAGSQDWFPRQSQDCINSYREYDAYAANNKERFKRERHPFIMYFSNKAFSGSKGKRSYSSVWEWRRTTGGNCTISWWERNGRRISGYTVTCDGR